MVLLCCEAAFRRLRGAAGTDRPSDAGASPSDANPALIDSTGGSPPWSQRAAAVGRAAPGRSARRWIARTEPQGGCILFDKQTDWSCAEMPPLDNVSDEGLD